MQIVDRKTVVYCCSWWFSYFEASFSSSLAAKRGSRTWPRCSVGARLVLSTVRKLSPAGWKQRRKQCACGLQSWCAAYLNGHQVCLSLQQHRSRKINTLDLDRLRRSAAIRTVQGSCASRYCRPCRSGVADRFNALAMIFDIASSFVRSPSCTVAN